MRAPPPDLSLDPMPADFTANIQNDGSVIKASVIIDGARYEIGLRPEQTDAAIAAAMEQLRIGIWELMEYARLGRADLMAYASASRHSNRQPSA